MLIQIDERTKAVTKIEGDAHVVVAINTDGSLVLRGYRFGVWNTTYANGTDSVLLEITNLVAELRRECAAIRATT